MTSNYMLISNHTANKLCEFSPTTHKLLLRGSTTKCVIKIALTIILYGAPLLVSLGWDLAVALKDRIKVISAKSGNNDMNIETQERLNLIQSKLDDIMNSSLRG